MRNADRIISELRQRPGLDDDELAERIGIIRQTVNQECRLLARKGVLIRERGGPRDKFVNRLCDAKERSHSAHQGIFLGRSTSRVDRESTGPATSQEAERIKVGNYDFERICEISPERDADGSVKRFTPQSRYRNSGNIRLNKYGQGPFCKFRIPSHHHQTGVYSIIVDGVVSYIGECENLSSRYNMGYGNISPRNCFVGGQETNCRVNTLIFHASTEGRKITLWFLKTAAFKSVEQELRALLKPEWNRI
jgi:DNA-binding Lrp family transcriptional regulator